VSASPCPDAELVLRYVAGDLDDARGDRIEAHVDACCTCASLVAHAAREVSRREPSVSLALSHTRSTGAPTGAGSPHRPRVAPERIGRYLVLGHLGSGGMGTVWSAIDPRLQRVVAIKRIEDAREQAPGDGERLLLEARALARLSHPNVVAVFEVGREPDAGGRTGDLYLVMELVEGHTLREHTRRHASEPDRIVSAYVQAARGLAAAHACGIVHRDFKPDNAIVGPGERVLVVDFGLAQPLCPAPSWSLLDTAEATGSRPRLDTQSPEPATREVAGTLPYMAPEQLAGAPADARSDQFSLCVSLWEALAGRRPGRDTSVGDGAGRIAPRIRRVLRRGLDRDPTRRFADMQSLVAALGSHRAAGQRTLAAAAVIALGLGVGVLLLPSTGGPECELSAAPITEAWDARVAAAVARPWSTRADAEVGPTAHLSRWADHWLARRARLCAADPASVHAGAACLRAQAESFRALVGLLREAPARDFSLWDAVHRLPDPARCDDPGPPHADDPRAAGVREAIARAQALRWATRADGARAITQRAVDDARALKDDGLLAAALLEHAAAVSATGDQRDAAVLFEDAFHRAEAAGLDAIAADAAAQQVFVVGVMLSDLPAGEAWARHAQAALDRLPERERPAIAATLATSVGNMWMDAERWAEARRQMELALELIEREHGPDHPLMVLALNDLGTVTRESDPDAALAYFERSVEVGLRAFGEEHPDVALALGNVGTVHENRGDPHAALPYLLRAKRIAEAVYEPDQAKLGLAIFNVGVVEQQLGDRDAAVASFSRALRIWAPPGREPGPFDGLAHVHLGELALGAGELDDAEAHFRSALARIGPAWGDDHPQCTVARDALAEIARQRETQRPS
jgi:eukaryotic-like serine/threonine-protein kinase